MEEKKFVKKNVKTLKAKDFAPNSEFVGVIFKYRERIIVDKTPDSDTFGEEKTIKDIIIIDNSNNEMIALPIDVGLKIALQDADAQLGDLVKIIKLPKTDLGHGKTVNSYEIYIAE